MKKASNGSKSNLEYQLKNGKLALIWYCKLNLELSRSICITAGNRMCWTFFKALIIKEFEQLMKCAHIEQFYIALCLKQQYI